MGYLMSVLKQKGHRVFFSDEYLQPSGVLTGNFLQQNNITHVGIYANTICYQSTLALIGLLKKKRDAGQWRGKILVGGPHTSFGADEIPPSVDHIVIGEGEISLPGIIDGEVTERIVTGKKVQDMDSLPMPAWEKFINLPYTWTHEWLTSSPVYTMNTSRGCPFHCSFCSVRSLWGKSYRCMSAERIVDDIQHMVKHYGAKGIYFREDHFTFKKERTIDFCQALLKKNIRIDWICETRVDQLDDPEYQQLMFDAGCKAFYIGVESGSPRMLNLFKKGETREQFVKAFEIARTTGIKTYASFVVGTPFETDDDERLTDDLIKEIRPDFLSKNIFLGIPGSELYDQIKLNNLYEYEDELHILYPKGYLKNVRKYYGDNPYYKTYSRFKIFQNYVSKQLV